MAGFRSEQRQTLRWTETESLPSGALSNTRKKKKKKNPIPCFTDPAVTMAIVSALHGGQLQYYTYRRGGVEAVCRRRRRGRGFQYTVYSECIVTCVCCQVLLNYIFVCNVETDVSFLYGGTTGSEQSNL